MRQNLGYGESFFYVYTELLDNREGLTLSIDGDALNSPSTWKLKGIEVGGKSTLSTLVVEKGPRLNVDRYKPIKLYLQSKCEFEGGEWCLETCPSLGKLSDSLLLEFGSKINSDLIWNVAREITPPPTTQSPTTKDATFSPSVSPSSSPTSTGTLAPTKSPAVIQPEIGRYIEFTRHCLEVQFDGDIKQVCSRIL